MTGIDAAAVGDQDRRAIVHHKAQPADAELLACPNCNSTNNLVLIEQAVVERLIQSAWAVGVTEPEIDAADYDDVYGTTILEAPPAVVVGVRCGNCRWGYKGSKPLDRLVKERP